MSKYECEHGRRIGKCADCDYQEALGEISDKDQQIKKLTEALENAMVAFCNQVEMDIIHPDHKHETESIADGIFKLLAEIKG